MSSTTSDHAYILHRRPYRETSAILDLFTEQHGRLSAVARGMQRRRSTLAALCQPLQSLRVCWSGRGDLKNLVSAERSGPVPANSADRLYSLMYCNELLTRCLPQHDPHPGLFMAYAELLHDIQVGPGPEPALRRFEFRLLAEMGYAPELDRVGVSRQQLDPQGRYRLVADAGMVAVSDSDTQPAYLGSTLLAIQRGDFSEHDTRRVAKRLFREALQPLLGPRPLASRELFRRRSR